LKKEFYSHVVIAWHAYTYQILSYGTVEEKLIHPDLGNK